LVLPCFTTGVEKKKKKGKKRRIEILLTGKKQKKRKKGGELTKAGQNELGGEMGGKRGRG